MPFHEPSGASEYPSLIRHTRPLGARTIMLLRNPHVSNDAEFARERQLRCCEKLAAPAETPSNSSVESLDSDKTVGIDGVETAHAMIPDVSVALDGEMEMGHSVKTVYIPPEGTEGEMKRMKVEKSKFTGYRKTMARERYGENAKAKIKVTMKRMVGLLDMEEANPLTQDTVEKTMLSRPEAPKRIKRLGQDDKVLRKSLGGAERIVEGSKRLEDTVDMVGEGDMGLNKGGVSEQGSRKGPAGNLGTGCKMRQTR